MNQTLLVACVMAGGLFAALVAPPPAQALPSVNLGIEKNADAVTPVARRGGMRGGFRGRGFRGGFRGARTFRGARAFRGGSFRRGLAVRGRAFRGRGGVRMRSLRRARAIRGRAIRGPRVAGFRRFRKRRFRGRRHRRFRRFYYGAPYVAYGYYYSGRCAWLRRRAYITGSPYWWSRYNRCRSYYY